MQRIPMAIAAALLVAVAAGCDKKEPKQSKKKPDEQKQKPKPEKRLEQKDAKTRAETESSEAQKPEPSENGDRPKWAVDPPLGCGVGSTKFRGNRSLARSSATGRARRSLAKRLQGEVREMLDKKEPPKKPGEHDSRDGGITLYGSEPENTHLSRGDNPRMYSLVCMQPGALEKTLNKMDSLSKNQTKTLVRRAEKQRDKLGLEP